MPSVLDPKAYHILAYGTLLGSNIFQTFLAGPLAFKALPRPSFSVLQQAIFPWYFALQTALPLALLLTWPGEKLVAHVAGDHMAIIRRNAGPRGLFATIGGHDSALWMALVPIAIMFGTSLVNMVWLGPATTKVMKQRKHQGIVDDNRAAAASRIWLTDIQKPKMARSTTMLDQSPRRCNA